MFTRVEGDSIMRMAKVKLTTKVKKIGDEPVKISAMASSQKCLTKPWMCAWSCYFWFSSSPLATVNLFPVASSCTSTPDMLGIFYVTAFEKEVCLQCTLCIEKCNADSALKNLVTILKSHNERQVLTQDSNISSRKTLLWDKVLDPPGQCLL